MASAAEILAAVEARSAAEAGAIVVATGDAAPLGAVLVERRGVCWVHLPRQAWRLRDLVHEHAGLVLDEATVATAAERCRATGMPLIDALGARHPATVAGVRQAIYQHVVESLVQLHGTLTTDLPWIPHATGGYQARDAYAPVHLLAAVGAARHPEPSGDLELPGPDVTRAGVTRGGVVRGHDGSAVLVDVTRVPGAVQLGVREAMRIAEWSIAALDACGGFSPAVLTRGAQLATGPTVLAWARSRRHVRFAIFDLPDHLAQAVDHVVRAQLPAVLAAWRALRPG